MADIEKVIKGLERCLKHTCPGIYSKEYKECEYTVGLYCGKDKLLNEALDLLKEQQAKIDRLKQGKFVNVDNCVRSLVLRRGVINARRIRGSVAEIRISQRRIFVKGWTLPLKS